MRNLWLETAQTSVMPTRNNETWQRLHLKTGNQCYIFFPFSEPPKKGDFWLYDNLNSSKPRQWLCSAQGPAPSILNSSQTLDVRLKCTRFPGKLLH